MGTHFSEAALKFLRGLKRNNDREWFAARKEIYERELKAPMLAVIGEVNEGLAEFAPEFVRDPAKCMFRIYRDTRFSKDKKPYKDHVAAWWVRRGLEKTSGGGLYFAVSATEVTVAAGVYMPQPPQLLAIRRHLLEHHAELRAMLEAKPLKKLGMAAMEPATMSRPPKGFPADHPGIELIKQRQWGVSAELPVETALSPKLVEEMVKRYRAAAPMIALLNEPLQPEVKGPLF
jgi:uncharacterized protein (TIGR02453 family)